ncbi:MAG: hypothetical protein M1815_005815 [Lichina confinis]|nr:MAG: hypothetical protein M1815_005815 [Lichina confinis]
MLTVPPLAAHDRVIVSFFYKFTDPDSDNKSYELTTVDGTATSENHVFFYREWASSLTRLQKASQLKRAFKEEQADIDHSYGRQLIRWRADRRDWELRLVFYVWDRGLARFPPSLHAQRKLIALRQTNRLFADFFTDFNRYAPRTGFNNKALKCHLRCAVFEKLAKQLAAPIREGLWSEDSQEAGDQPSQDTPVIRHRHRVGSHKWQDSR